MCWFNAVSPHKIEEIVPPDGMNSDQEKQWRVSLLTDEESIAFEWFRQGYTARWTAETMLLNRKAARKLFSSIYRKLCVKNETEVSRIYRTAKVTPRELPLE